MPSPKYTTKAGLVEKEIEMNKRWIDLGNEGLIGVSDIQAVVAMPEPSEWSDLSDRERWARGCRTLILTFHGVLYIQASVEDVKTQLLSTEAKP